MIKSWELLWLHLLSRSLAHSSPDTLPSLCFSNTLDTFLPAVLALDALCAGISSHSSICMTLFHFIQISAKMSLTPNTPYKILQTHLISSLSSLKQGNYFSSILCTYHHLTNINLFPFYLLPLGYELHESRDFGLFILCFILNIQNSALHEIGIPKIFVA